MEIHGLLLDYEFKSFKNEIIKLNRKYKKINGNTLIKYKFYEGIKIR
jgi:hypothetical protein